MTSTCKSFLTAALLLILLPCRAEPELAAQRAQVEAQFLRESEVCETRFAVSACLDIARERRRAALKPLAALEDALDAAERQARVQAQRERVAERQRAAAADDGQRQTELVRQASVAAAAPQSAASRTPLAAPASHAESLKVRTAEAQQAAQRRRAQTAERQLRQQAHQAEVQRRAASAKKPAAPLPLPATAASGSSR